MVKYRMKEDKTLYSTWLSPMSNVKKYDCQQSGLFLLLHIYVLNVQFLFRYTLLIALSYPMHYIVYTVYHSCTHRTYRKRWRGVQLMMSAQLLFCYQKCSETSLLIGVISYVQLLVRLRLQDLSHIVRLVHSFSYNLRFITYKGKASFRFSMNTIFFYKIQYFTISMDSFYMIWIYDSKSTNWSQNDTKNMYGYCDKGLI